MIAIVEIRDLYLELLKSSVLDSVHPAEDALVPMSPARGSSTVRAWVWGLLNRAAQKRGLELAERTTVPRAFTEDGRYNPRLPFRGETMSGAKRLDTVRF